MRLSVTLLLAVGLIVLLAAPLAGQEALPRLTVVEPANGKAGDILTVTGENLGKAIVAELYVTDSKTDWKAEMTEQSDTSIKFKIPGNVKPGRYKLMVLTKGKEPKLIEQPVRVEIE